MSTLAVVEVILRETGVPMSVRQIVEHSDGRLPTKSKTPDTVVARDLSMDIKKKGEESLFIRTAPGRYTLRALHLALQAEQADRERDPSHGRDGSNGSVGNHTAAHQASVADHSDSNPTSTTDLVSSALSAERRGTLPAKNTTVQSDRVRDAE
ncbi:MAG: winged helix-turn-helix domain-containing protein [Myxococcota bacterium]